MSNNRTVVTSMLNEIQKMLGDNECVYYKGQSKRCAPRGELDITIWLQHYFLFLTTIVESLTSSNMSSPALSFKSSTTWEGIVINKLLPILRSFSLISISNTYPRDILKYRDIIIVFCGYHSGKMVVEL
ncbi:MAG: hypothetical protein WBF33_26380 [Candidatus Nitrosopolaris sp.]|jgi:hypothetical protein